MAQPAPLRFHTLATPSYFLGGSRLIAKFRMSRVGVLSSAGKARRVQSHRIGKDRFLGCRDWIACCGGSACGCTLRDLDAGCLPSPNATHQRSDHWTWLSTCPGPLLDHLCMGALTSCWISRYLLSDCSFGRTPDRSWLLRFRGNDHGILCRLNEGAVKRRDEKANACSTRPWINHDHGWLIPSVQAKHRNEEPQKAAPPG